ncbi:tyrosine-type recombinase/integrase [Dokdonia sp.]|uniref:tyrosine-type recombinase/integrase n=1 Tax=Dokdonia sp. TaxID=2024995 RepID=UPI003263EF99
MYFNLKEPKSDKDTLIILTYFIDPKERQFKYSTSQKVKPTDWNFDAKVPKSKRGRTDLSVLSKKLQRYSDFLIKTLDTLEIHEIPITKIVLKERFDLEFKGNHTISKFKYLTDFVDDFILKAPELINRNTKRKYASTKIKQYKTANNRLKDYESFKNRRVPITGFTISIYDDLRVFLQDEKKYSVNYTGDIIKNMIVFLGLAESEYNYKVHQDYKKKTFSVIKEESKSVYLNHFEIETLLKHDFSFNKTYQKTRDWCVIGCWVGLRVGDLMDLPPIDITEKFIEVQPKKTKDSTGIKVVIPLHHHIKEIINKRGMPTKMQDVHYNKHIKTVCRAVGIKQVVAGSVMKNKRKVPGRYPKYKLISSHTCRRSFATNLYKMNFPTLSIMKITGHSKEETFLSYIKVTPTEHAEKLLTLYDEYYKN